MRRTSTAVVTANTTITVIAKARSTFEVQRAREREPDHAGAQRCDEDGPGARAPPGSRQTAASRDRSVRAASGLGTCAEDRDACADHRDLRTPRELSYVSSATRGAIRTVEGLEPVDDGRRDPNRLDRLVVVRRPIHRMPWSRRRRRDGGGGCRRSERAPPPVRALRASGALHRLPHQWRPGDGGGVHAGRVRRRSGGGPSASIRRAARSRPGSSRSRATSRSARCGVSARPSSSISSTRSSTTAGPDELVASADAAAQLADAMANLPEPQLAVLQLAYFEGLSQSEIATQARASRSERSRAGCGSRSSVCGCSSTMRRRSSG